jgi:hypothetical protein
MWRQGARENAIPGRVMRLGDLYDSISAKRMTSEVQSRGMTGLV